MELFTTDSSPEIALHIPVRLGMSVRARYGIPMALKSAGSSTASWLTSGVEGRTGGSPHIQPCFIDL